MVGDNEKKNRPSRIGAGVGLSLGTSFGIVFGQIFFDNVGLGLALGASMGLIFGTAIERVFEIEEDKRGARETLDPSVGEASGVTPNQRPE